MIANLNVKDGDWEGLRHALHFLASLMPYYRVRIGKVVSVASGSLTVTLRRYDQSWQDNSEQLTVNPLGFLGSNSDLTGNVWPSYAANDPVPVFLAEDNAWYTAHLFEDTYECP